jgi:NADPH:quinone reductase-like Zn-dependent oxidoreductase
VKAISSASTLRARSDAARGHGNPDAAGVNHANVGLWANVMGGPHRVELPFTPGFEVVGTVEAVGADVHGFQVGQRVTSVLETGGFAQYAVAPMDRDAPGDSGAACS